MNEHDPNTSANLQHGGPEEVRSQEARPPSVAENAKKGITEQSKPGRPADAEQVISVDGERQRSNRTTSSRTINQPAEQRQQQKDFVTTGERYLYGRGRARDCTQALRYFKAAAAEESAQAFSHLGALYATGECVPMDRAMAYMWFQKAHAREPNNPYFGQNLAMLWRDMSQQERERASLGKP